LEIPGDEVGAELRLFCTVKGIDELLVVGILRLSAVGHPYDPWETA
jgi:hypothetical protein